MKVIILSLSSDIGLALARRWVSRGWQVFGTFRSSSPELESVARQGARLVSCDLRSAEETNRACGDLRAICPAWDVLVLGAGTQEPIGPFMQNDFAEWRESVNVNFVSQLQVLHALWPARNTARAGGPSVLFFAGGGTNNATVNYSAYTVSKIALIKMCELLDAEMADARFSIIGPGWVKTKIHDETLRAGAKAGENYDRTRRKLADDEFTPMDKVIDCCEWVVGSRREVVGGRNFSVVFDAWGDDRLDEALLADPDMYKLRRWGNDRLTRPDR